MTSNTYLTPIDSSEIAPSALQLSSLINGRDSKITTIIAEAGSADLFDNPLPADIAYIGYMYTSYTAESTAIFDTLIDQFLGNNKVISGSVVDTNGQPVQLDVFAVNLTNKVVTYTTSDANGNYTLTVKAAYEYAVFCVDEVAGAKIYVG